MLLETMVREQQKKNDTFEEKDSFNPGTAYIIKDNFVHDPSHE